MRNQFTLVDKAGLDFAFSLYEKFLATCPDGVWQETFGGRPVAMQIYHAISASAVYLQLFTGESFVNDFPEAVDPFPETGLPSAMVAPLPSRAQALELLKTVKARLDTLLAGLSDSELLRANGPVSSFLGGQINNAGVLGIMIAHMLYHLGSGDAALRANGITGAFSGLALVRQFLTNPGS